MQRMTAIEPALRVWGDTEPRRMANGRNGVTATTRRGNDRGRRDGAFLPRARGSGPVPHVRY